ncbi:unnamed protein product [Spirodela intermedia]|uniref:Zinc finger PMZ-type domain-containing protein n=1 Tax=Spirodela intermedia TaxID=51605 RepID=A0A7I8J0J3_SPIIN|nr:unnamed protein product [Spirodela intermedia]CAA6662840.1 unnamed protein product [Spirodela intermedia]
MANHDLVLGQNPDLALGQNHELGMRQAHALGIGQAHSLGLGQGQDHKLGLGSAHDHGLGLGHPHDSELVLVERSHELALQQGNEIGEGQLMVHPVLQSALEVGQDALHCQMCWRGLPLAHPRSQAPRVPTFTIRTIHESHTCSGISHLGHQQASVQWVANSVEERLRENPHYKPKEILEEIHRVHGITLSYKQAWRGKERIMAAVRGSFEEGYRLLPQYCEQIRRTNPGSIANVYGNQEDNCFRRLFISFYASIYGFVNACRPLIGGFDGDGSLFPLAFGVVDEENEENWIWFLSELHNLLETNTENMPRLTILSDRQKGIVEGVDFNFPTAFHGYCMRHLSENFRKEFNNTMLVNLLWEAAQALTGTRFRHLTASIVESLNPWLHEASGLPIIQMMETIRRQLMTWFNERREISMQWTSPLVPSADRHVAEAATAPAATRWCVPTRPNSRLPLPMRPNIVDIRNRCCFVRGWQLYGLPCVHAVAALHSCRQNVSRFTESCFTVTNYRNVLSDDPSDPRQEPLEGVDRGLSGGCPLQSLQQNWPLRTTCAAPI